MISVRNGRPDGTLLWATGPLAEIFAPPDASAHDRLALRPGARSP